MENVTNVNNVRTPKVYVTHEPSLRRNNETGELELTRDVGIARKFGELKCIFPAGHLPANPSYAMQMAREKLYDFGSDDFLLLSGDTMAIAVSAIVASQMLDENERTLKILLWSNWFRDYHVSEVDVWEDDVWEDDVCENDVRKDDKDEPNSPL